MTESLFQKLEEKVVTMISEVEQLRKELVRVSQENTALLAEKANQAQKLQGLVALIETLDVTSEVSFLRDNTVTSINRVEEVVGAV